MPVPPIHGAHRFAATGIDSRRFVPQPVVDLAFADDGVVAHGVHAIPLATSAEKQIVWHAAGGVGNISPFLKHNNRRIRHLPV